MGDWFQNLVAWAFGELGFEFWNWPRLTSAFIRHFEKQLGSRVISVSGKL
jgi:hypothetical protein